MFTTVHPFRVRTSTGRGGGGRRLLRATFALHQRAQLVRVHRLLVAHVSERRAAQRRGQTARAVSALQRALLLLRLLLRLRLRDDTLSRSVCMPYTDHILVQYSVRVL